MKRQRERRRELLTELESTWLNNRKRSGPLSLAITAPRRKLVFPLSRRLPNHRKGWWSTRSATSSRWKGGRST
jgi:hypothetical protein